MSQPEQEAENRARGRMWGGVKSWGGQRLLVEEDGVHEAAHVVGQGVGTRDQHVAQQFALQGGAAAGRVDVALQVGHEAHEVLQQALDGSFSCSGIERAIRGAGGLNVHGVCDFAPWKNCAFRALT
jgi:hypothetical protein